MKKQVFIVADIGLDKNNAYHVGDEAMFICNLERYKKLDFRVVSSSRSLTHSKKDFLEVYDIYITNFLTFVWLVFISLICKFTSFNFFPRRFKPTVKELIASHLVHISGGGNIASFWPGHIYYRCLVIFLAHLYNIPVIMTSQTIGPLSTHIHKLTLAYCLNKVAFIGVRDQEYSFNQLDAIGVHNPEIIVMPDDTTFLGVPEVIPVIFNQDGIIKVGLSLHSWTKDFSIFARAIEHLVRAHTNIHFYLIPHYFDNQNNIDIDYMEKIVANVPSERVHAFKFSDIFNAGDINNIPKQIKAITSQMDIVISSRYHGLVFALSSEVPVLAINYDEYYTAKNNGVLEQYFHDFLQYNIQYADMSPENFLNKFEHILQSQNSLKRILTNELSLLECFKEQFYSNLAHTYTK